MSPTLARLSYREEIDLGYLEYRRKQARCLFSPYKPVYEMRTTVLGPPEI